MRLLRTMIATAAATAVALAFPVSPAQAAIAIDVEYSTSCGRVTAISDTPTRVVVYYGSEALLTSVTNAEGAVILDQYEVGTIATNRSKLYLVELVVGADLDTAVTKTITVPQDCTGVSKAKLSITGTKRVGKTLTAKVGTWVPVPLFQTYQWYRNGKAITDATDSTYTVVAADRGKRLKVKVTATFVGYATASRTSKSTAKIKAGVLTSARPTISRFEWTATAAAGTWSPTPVTLKYQWYLGGKKIAGATSATFDIPASYVNKKIQVRVVGTKAGYTKQVRFSKKFLVTPSS
jgi:hypothetical protein